MPRKCAYCSDPVCLDDFITGDCPAEESVEECGCLVIRDTETGDVLEVIEECQRCKEQIEEDEYEQLLSEKRLDTY